ncbi:MAG: DNA-processing protein DprA, partial [Actinomycetota bacterium]
MAPRVDQEAERRSRMLLSLWSEPGDEHLVAHVATVGAARVVDEILAWASPLRRAPAMETRIGTSPRDAALLAEPLGERAARCGARYVVPGDAEWPTQLDDLLKRAPLGLWVAGAANLRTMAAFSVAMVGARASTPYGEGVALISRPCSRMRAMSDA